MKIIKYSLVDLYYYKYATLTWMFWSKLFSVENIFCSRSIESILEFMFHDGHSTNLLAYKSKNCRFTRSSMIFGNIDNYKQWQ